MPDYYALTTAFTGVATTGAGLVAVLQQPPATVDLASSLRLIFCISRSFLVVKQISSSAIPRLTERRNPSIENYSDIVIFFILHISFYFL
jgi:hypothetical protein